MNTRNFQNINEIAEGMRTTGELDEDKLKRFKKFFYLRTRIIPIVTLIVFLAFKDWSIYSDVMYCILLVCAYKYIYLGYVKDITFRLELFNSGYQVVGEVVAVCEASPMEAVRISYKASDGNDYQNKNGICLPAISWQRKKVVDQMDLFSEGQAVEIIVLEDKPEYFWLYTDQLNTIYNIRKG